MKSRRWVWNETYQCRVVGNESVSQDQRASFNGTKQHSDIVSQEKRVGHNGAAVVQVEQDAPLIVGDGHVLETDKPLVKDGSKVFTISPRDGRAVQIDQHGFHVPLTNNLLVATPQETLRLIIVVVVSCKDIVPVVFSPCHISSACARSIIDIGYMNSRLSSAMLGVE